MSSSTASLTVVLATIALLASCSFEDPCEFGTCLNEDAGAVNTDAGNDATRNSDASNGSPDTGDSSPNSGNTEPNNVTSHDAGSNNTTRDAGTDPNGDTGGDTSPVCEVDVFDFTCAADEYEVNDTFPRNLATIGCTPAGNLRTLDTTLDARVCPLERADLFDIIISSCDARPVTLQISIELENTCSDSLWELVIPSCQDEDLRCRTSADGRTVTLEQTAGAVGVNTPVFGVRTSADIFLDYRLHVQSPAP